MTLISSIESKLQSYPDLAFKVDSDTISVTPENGFTVWATEHNSHFTVGFEGWHEHFTELDEALNCFAWGLSEECRLKITYRGAKACKWTVQHRENGEWRDDSTTGLLIIPFWRGVTYSCRQNHVLASGPFEPPQ